MRLVGLKYERADILDALSKTGLVQITEGSIENISRAEKCVDKQVLTEKYQKTVKSIDFIEESAKAYYGKKSKEEVKFFAHFDATYQDLKTVKDKEEQLLSVISASENAQQILQENKNLRIKCNNAILQYQPYTQLKEKLNSYKDTKTTKVFLGTITQDGLTQLNELYKDNELINISSYVNNGTNVIVAVCFNGLDEQFAKSLQTLGFARADFDDDRTAKDVIKDYKESITESVKQDKKVLKSVAELYKNDRDLKLLCDYYKVEIEKLDATERFNCTGETFILDAFVPVDSVEYVQKTVKNVTNTVFFEFTEPKEDDVVPTLTKNGRISKNAEFVTNMYSVPNYREVDPNKSVFFFFMLFMGIIMADMGYGLLMVILGAVISAKSSSKGSKDLFRIIAIAGIPTIIIGFLFNSLFGFAVLPFRVLPDPTETSNKANIMIMLLACLGVGIVQICVGYTLRAINQFRQGDIFGGIVDSLMWDVFFVGFLMATFNFFMDYFNIVKSADFSNNSVTAFFIPLTNIGLYLIIGSLAVIVLTAGRKEKFFGKFTKGFGALYGLISIFSDILSYARLFGLMLSSMIISVQFNAMATGMLQGGGAGVILGVIVILIGHSFNFAMGILGAYIHDSRLQYIEYFGKFYTGEGEMFTPIGSKFDYINIKG